VGVDDASTIFEHARNTLVQQRIAEQQRQKTLPLF
jgi:hypothetical protein